MEDNGKFKGRSLTSFLSFWSFLILSVTGVILYFTPAGRVANWINWTMLGLDKESWQGIHIIFALMFLLVTAFHLFFNWVALINYFRNTFRQGFIRRKELAVSFIITFIIVLISLLEINPFWKLVNYRGNLKHEDGIVYIAPPIPHAEDLRLSEFADMLRLPLENIENDLKSEGFQVSGVDATLFEIASANETSPEKLYYLIFEKETFGEAGLPEISRKVRGADDNGLTNNRLNGYSGKRQGTGLNHNRKAKYYGRKTIKQLCIDAGIGLEKGIDILKSSGIGDIEQNDRVRDVAGKYGLRPSDISRYLERRK